MRYKKAISLMLCLWICGCATTENLIMGTDYTNYKKRAQEIEHSYQKGEITKAEYLDLKLKNEQVYQNIKEK